MIKIKRVYDKVDKDDGFRILVDKLWPKGLEKEEARVDLWLKEIAPNPSLRKWFGQEVKKFPEFVKRYKEELKSRQRFLNRIKDIEEEHETVTLLFGAKDREHNIAVVLQEVLIIRR